VATSWLRFLGRLETLQPKRSAFTDLIEEFSPWFLGDTVEGLDVRIATHARNTKKAGLAIMAQRYALNEPPKYHAGDEPGRAALANFAPAALENYLRIFDDFTYGDMGSDHTMLAAHVNSLFDPTRAPPGKAALSVFAFGPYALRDGGAAAWNTRKAELGDWILVCCSNADRLAPIKYPMVECSVAFVSALRARFPYIYVGA